MDFKLHAPYSATGDQPEAIRKLTEGVRLGLDEQVLLGVTGSGKTFTMASVIANLNRPTLVLAHNKTLAAQLCSEFREFFPENAVEYFISYYDYYQPEAYIAHTDTYIEKDSAINDEIERLRHSATSSLFERRDVIVVSSVSCIYGLGDPIDYKNMVISLRTGMEKSREELMQKLVEIRYERNDLNFTRNTFRVRGDTVEIYPVYWSGRAIRVEFFGDEIDRISEINAVTGVPERILNHVAIYPASHYVASKEKMARAMKDIEAEMWEQVRFFEEHDKLLEAQRIRQRTQYDLEMLQAAVTVAERVEMVLAGRNGSVGGRYQQSAGITPSGVCGKCGPDQAGHGSQDGGNDRGGPENPVGSRVDGDGTANSRRPRPGRGPVQIHLYRRADQHGAGGRGGGEEHAGDQLSLPGLPGAGVLHRPWLCQRTGRLCRKVLCRRRRHGGLRRGRPFRRHCWTPRPAERRGGDAAHHTPGAGPV